MENNNSNLPMIQKNILPAKIKDGLIKGGKILGLSTSTALLFGASVVSAAFLSPIVIPSCLAMCYSAQKLLNQTLYTSHKDIAFITRKVNDNIKIFQDISKLDITAKLLGKSTSEKAAFIELQAIVGLSKLNNIDKSGEPVQFETDTHTVVRKTLRKLADAGMLQDFSEEPIKRNGKNVSKYLVLPKLAFGNIKGLKDKVDMYNVKFQLGDKIDINDEKLRQLFPLVFSKRRGLLAKYNYNIIQNPDVSLSIDYKADKPFINNSSPSQDSSFINSLQEGTPTLQEQKEFIQEFNHQIINDKNNPEKAQGENCIE